MWNNCFFLLEIILCGRWVSAAALIELWYASHNISLFVWSSIVCSVHIFCRSDSEKRSSANWMNLWVPLYHIQTPIFQKLCLLLFIHPADNVCGVKYTFYNFVIAISNQLWVYDARIQYRLWPAATYSNVINSRWSTFIRPCISTAEGIIFSKGVNESLGLKPPDYSATNRVTHIIFYRSL